MEFEKFERLINESEIKIVIDTNVLLDLVRYPIYVSKNILEIFNKCSDLLWIPNQVLYEYEKSKNKVFGDYKKKYSSFQSDLLNCLGKFEKGIKTKLNNGNRYNFHGLEILEDDINKSIDQLRNEIANYNKNIGKEYSITQEKNPYIFQEIENLVQTIVNKKQIGRKLKIQEKLNIIEEGEIRYKYNIPPGYKDGDKLDISKFGDLFIWKEIIEFSKNRTNNTIFFITNDFKEDWWKLDKNGNILEINSSLKQEFEESCQNVSIEFFSLNGFYDLASQLYNLDNYQVYIDLNREDENYIKRVIGKIALTLEDCLFKNPELYLQYKDSLKIRENIEVKNNNYEILSVYSKRLNNSIEYNYNIKLNVCIDIYSDEPINCTKEDPILKTFKISQKYEGAIEILINRIINKDNLISNEKFLSTDSEFTNFKILQLNLKQNINSESNIFFFDEDKLEFMFE